MDKFYVDTIEQIVGNDFAHRGIEGLVQRCRGSLHDAAMSLSRAKKVLITTGFFVPAGAPETDGPCGVAALILALDKLGIRADLIVDPHCIPVADAIVHFLEKREIRSETIICAGPLRSDDHFAHLLDRSKVAVDTYHRISQSPELHREYFTKLLQGSGYSHYVSIERVGAASDGQYYSMRGIDVSSQTGLIDKLFGIVRADNMGVTVCVGDGGNEIGMGNQRQRIALDVPLGEKIGCTTECDHLICCGVSNWGGYALAAALGVITNSSACFWSWQDDCEMMRELVQNGAVDGVSGKPTELTVDGIDGETHRAVINIVAAVGVLPLHPGA